MLKKISSQYEQYEITKKYVKVKMFLKKGFVAKFQLNRSIFPLSA